MPIPVSEGGTDERLQLKTGSQMALLVCIWQSSNWVSRLPTYGPETASDPNTNTLQGNPNKDHAKQTTGMVLEETSGKVCHVTAEVHDSLGAVGDHRKQAPTTKAHPTVTTRHIKVKQRASFFLRFKLVYRGFGNFPRQSQAIFQFGGDIKGIILRHGWL